MDIIALIWYFIVCFCTIALVNALTCFIIYKVLRNRYENFMKGLGDDIFENLMPIIEDKIHDSDIIDELVEQTFIKIGQRFGGEKSGTVRQEKAVDRKIIKALVSTNPLIGALAEQTGLMPMLEKNPNLVFYILHKYPGLFQMGMGGDSSDTPSQLSPLPTSSTPPMPSTSQS